MFEGPEGRGAELLISQEKGRKLRRSSRSQFIAILKLMGKPWGSAMYFFYDLLSDIMLLGILALGFCLVCVVVLISLEMPRLLFAASRRLMDLVMRTVSAHGGLRMKFFFDRTTHGHRGA